MLRKLIFILCLLHLPGLLLAEDEAVRYFNVEIIVFENTDKASRENELPTTVKHDNDLLQAPYKVQLGMPYTRPDSRKYQSNLLFTLIPKHQLLLTDAAKRIERSSRRRVLLHTAWRQPGLSKEEAIWVSFRQLLDGASVQPDSIPRLEGNIKVILSRYLHVDTDILYYENIDATLPATSTHSEGNPLAYNTENIAPYAVYQMKQMRRRIRSEELHYLDHPVLGMMLMITPYEQ